MAEDLPTFNQEIQKLEELIDSFDFDTVKTTFDNSKSLLKNEYASAKLLYHKNTVLLKDMRTCPIEALIGSKPEYKDE
jgi:hypothetical protein